MSGFIGRDYPFKVTTVDGTALYEGTCILGMVYDVIMVSQAISAGHVIKVDTTNTVIPRMDYTAANTIPNQVLKGAIGAAATGVHLGVAITPCGSNAAGEKILVAGPGSIAPVFRSATLTVLNFAIAAATGQVSSNGTATAMQTVGQVINIDITGGTGNMGSILVMPQ